MEIVPTPPVNPEPKWEEVTGDGASSTKRLRVPGGFLYRHAEILTTKVDQFGRPEPIVASMAMCFVPDENTLKEISTKLDGFFHK